MPLGQQTISQMGSDEPGYSGDEDFHEERAAAGGEGTSGEAAVDSVQSTVFSRRTRIRDNNSIETEAAVNEPTKAPSVIQRRYIGSAWRLGDFERGGSKRSPQRQGLKLEFET